MNVNIPELNNPKDFFLKHDGLRNLGYDLDFSILQKYRCFANCKMCYIKGDWVSSDELPKYIPKRAPTRTELMQLLEVFSYFEVVSIIDDMKFMKEECPHLYKFYLENAKIFHLSSMSDNAIYRHKRLLCEEFFPLAIHEITVSEEFVNRVPLVDLIQTLREIHSHVPIKKIKLVIMLNQGNQKPMLHIIDWANANGILIQKQLELVEGIEKAANNLNQDLLVFDDARLYESTVYSEEFGAIYPIHSDVLFLMHDCFYSELKSATNTNRNPPFARLSRESDFNPIFFMAEVLQGKIKDYEFYVKNIKNHSNQYFSYFQYVSENLQINPNFNFIPKPILPPFSKYYKNLIKKDLVIETKYGLLVKGYEQSENIIPLLGFTPKD